MSKKLVAYFSATGKTAKVAEKLAAGIDADLYEIKPEVKYTKADLNWMNKKSRSSVEMNDKSIRPTIVTGDVDVSGYDTIYLGFGSNTAYRSKLFIACSDFFAKIRARSGCLTPLSCFRCRFLI